MNIKKLSIIIPTWNSMPEFKKCIISIKDAFPREAVKEIIVIDKNSNDGTIEYAKRNGCVVLNNNKSLGSARLMGLNYAKTKWVVFIDSDIKLPKNWFNNMLSIYNDINNDKVGWIYGRTIDDIYPIRDENLYKIDINFAKLPWRYTTERAYTNNTLCLRKPLLSSNIENLNAWEDYVMTQTMIKAGHSVVETRLTCEHLRSDTYSKFGVMTEAWGIAGELKAKGFNPKTILRPFWFLYWGIRCCIHFRDLEHFLHNNRIFWSMVRALLSTHKAFGWSRDKSKGIGFNVK